MIGGPTVVFQGCGDLGNRVVPSATGSALRAPSIDSSVFYVLKSRLWDMQMLLPGMFRHFYFRTLTSQRLFAKNGNLVM